MCIGRRSITENSLLLKPWRPGLRKELQTISGLLCIESEAELFNICIECVKRGPNACLDLTGFDLEMLKKKNSKFLKH